jgi:hypothetical protein
VISRLRKTLTAAFGRGDTERPPEREDNEVDRRLEAARRRLKNAIPPRED